MLQEHFKKTHKKHDFIKSLKEISNRSFLKIKFLPKLDEISKKKPITITNSL